LGGGGDAPSAEPSEAPASEQAPSQTSGEGVGDAPSGDGEADWRKAFLDADPDLGKTLARFKGPEEFVKSYSELRAKLSAPREAPTLPEDATDEQIAEYREAMGVPAEGTREAYGVAAPEGYVMAEAEQAALDEFVKSMHGQHMPPAAVKAATDQFFRAQMDVQEALRTQDVERRKEWSAQLKSEFGKDTQAKLAAGSTIFDQMCDGDDRVKSEILQARLPSGGFIGDHPIFAKAMIDLAEAAGMTDRIEGDIYESGGKSLAEQQREIEALRGTDRKKYKEMSAPGGRLEKLIDLRIKRGEIDENGRELRKRSA
jgi:hypothetical protein